MAKDIAIDIGTAYTSIFISGAGVVLREPTAVAFIGEGERRKVLAVGNEAIKMKGSAPDKTTVVCPVVDGYVSDVDACKKMMEAFMRKVLPISYVFFPKYRGILVVPTGLTMEERRTYEDILHFAGIAEVTMVDNSIATALGLDLPIDSPCGGLVVNIGGGVTEIAITSLCGIVSGCSVSVGGNMMDHAFSDYLLGKYGIRAGLLTACKVKEEIGSLYPNDISSMEIRGVSVSTMTPTSETVYATDVYEALQPYYVRIAEAVEGITNLCPPELASAIHAKGIFMAGGGAKIPGIAKLFESNIDLPITVADAPEYVTIVGAGKLLGNRVLLEKIHEQQ